MSKILAVAKAEYFVAIRSKAFLIGVFMMPVLMLGGVVAQILLKDQVDKTDRVCVIVDQSGLMMPLVQQANQWRTENEVFETTEEGETKQVRPKFIFEPYQSDQDMDTIHRELTERVKSKELVGYAIIDSQVLSTERNSDRRSIAYHTNTPSYSELPGWIEYVVNRETQRIRFERSGLDQDLVNKLSSRVRLTSLGLVEKTDESGTAKAEENNELRTFAIPIAAMFLLFMLIMMTAPTLLNQVLEEKTQKISEILISAVSPFQLLMGKLLATVGVALSLSTLYLSAIYAATVYFGFSDLIDPIVYPWFFLFLIMALFMYGSIFSAIGAACNEIKDAQSLMTPAMIIVMIPFFTFSIILQSPNSTFAAGMSLFPPATPTVMLLRILLDPGPPLWQLLLGIVLTAAFSVFCVAAAGKVFRIGILAQGQTPNLWQLIKWIVSK